MDSVLSQNSRSQEFKKSRTRELTPPWLLLHRILSPKKLRELSSLMTNEYRSLVLAAGENYRLVPFDVSFTEALFEAARESRNELIRFVSWYYPEYSMEDSRRWLQGRERERFEGRSYDFAITDAKHGELIGGCGIDRIQSKNRLGNLYYWVRTSQTNKGAATAAASAIAKFGLNTLNLIRLEIVVAETNFVGQSVAEKIGASREIRLPNRLILEGQILHAYLFSLLSQKRRS